METQSGGQVGLDAAARLFAGEIGQTTQIRGGSFRSPTGAAGRRVFFAGALTAVSSGGGRVSARIADPTGSVTVLAGWREAAAASALQAIEPPAFVAVTGALALAGGETVIVPETVARVERSVRDLWVLRTSDLTLSRIERIIDAPADTAAPDTLAELLQMVRAALRTVQDAGTPAAPIDARTVLIALLEEAPGRRTAEEALLAAVAERGIGREAARAALAELMEEGECYMPSTGQVKLI